MYVTNAFSLNMAETLDTEFRVQFSPVTVEEAKTLSVENAIGHDDTARVVGSLLGKDGFQQGNRINVKLKAGESVLIAQYFGPRLPEGATTLPEGANIKFVLATILP